MLTLNAIRVKSSKKYSKFNPYVEAIQSNSKLDAGENILEAIFMYFCAQPILFALPYLLSTGRVLHIPRSLFQVHTTRASVKRRNSCTFKYIRILLVLLTCFCDGGFTYTFDAIVSRSSCSTNPPTQINIPQDLLILCICWTSLEGHFCIPAMKRYPVEITSKYKTQNEFVCDLPIICV